LTDHSHGSGAPRRLIATVHDDFPRDSGRGGRVAGAQARPGYAACTMSPTWIWMQVAIVVFVLIGMIVAITKLA
jgi:hypothetical protein